MPSYDSDSSDGGEDYTETNVLLGYATKESTGDAISHLGDFPSWLDEKSAPSGALAKCEVCNDLLSLLLELNGDLPDHFPGHERRLYIFSCRRRTCRRKEGSVRGIRGVRIAKKTPSNTSGRKAERKEIKEEPERLSRIGGSLFGVKDESATSRPANPFANPFSSTTNGKAPANPFSSPLVVASRSSGTAASPERSAETEQEANTELPETFASKLSLNLPQSSSQLPRPHEPWPDKSEFPPAYPHYHLDAEYETLDIPANLEIPANARMDIDADGSGGSGGKEDKEVFESSMDKTFQKFADQIGQNAEQVLRYEFNGNALLYSDSDAVGKLLGAHSPSSNAKVTVSGSKGRSGMPRCQNCGADRVFEVQLTPHAITELEVDEMGIEGMEWGTIILGVCSKDCKPSDISEGEVGYVEEWVGVQWEQLAAK